MKFAECGECIENGKPAGYHTVSTDGREVFVHCSTCGKLVVTFVLSENVIMA